VQARGVTDEAGMIALGRERGWDQEFRKYLG
jgi:hypothetical protein